LAFNGAPIRAFTIRRNPHPQKHGAPANVVDELKKLV
jgi:hypothetical protein